MGRKHRGARVAHVTVVHRGQDPRIHRKQCISLADAGYEVHLLIGGMEEGLHEGIEIHPVSPEASRPRLRRQLPRQWRATREALRLRADVYHLHDPHLIPLGVVLKLRGARVVYDVHEHYPLHARSKLQGRPLRAGAKARMWHVLEAVARRSFDGFVCASDALARRFPPERTVKVGNFPLLEEFESVPSAPPLQERDQVALFLGCARPDRGVFELVEAARLFPDDLGARLRFAGEMRPPGLPEQIMELPWSERIEILPESRDREWVARRLDEAVVGVAVQTPWFNAFEGWRSNKLFEYMAAGLPVVVADAPHWREIVDRYHCGVAVAADDPAAIAAAISDLLRDRDRAAELGRNGRAAVLSELNWEIEVGGLMELYERLAPRPDPPAPEPGHVARPPVNESGRDKAQAGV